MDKNELEKKLENLSVPQLPQLEHQQQLKLSIMSAKKSARASLWLLLIPFLFFVSAFLRQLNISIPGSLLDEYSLHWSSWLRILVFAVIIIGFPLIAVILNLLSIIWLQYDREQKVLNISIRMRTVNLVIIVVAGLVALLFTIVMIMD